MLQIVLVFFLQLYGFLLATALFPRIAPTFFACTGILWASLVWTTVSLFCLIFEVGNLEIIFSSVFLITGGAALAWHLQHGRWQRIANIKFAGILGAFVLVLVAMAVIKPINLTPDSVWQLRLGEYFASESLTAESAAHFGDWAPMLPIMHGLSTWLNVVYLNGLQAAYAFALISSSVWFTNYILKNYDPLPAPLQFAPLIVGLILASNYGVIYQAIYIHNSILAAAFFAPAVLFLWLAHVEARTDYLTLSFLAFFGFSFTRTESLLYAVLYIALALHYRRFSGRIWLQLTLAYITPLLIWHVWLYNTIGKSIILNQERVLLLIVILVTLPIAVIVAQGNTIIHKAIIPKVPRLLVFALWTALLLLTVLSPFHMAASTLQSMANLVISGLNWWGPIWISLLVVHQVIVRAPHLPYQKLLTSGTLMFFAFTWLFPIARKAYRPGFGDSSNRMFTHILPIILIYVTIRVVLFIGMNMGNATESAPDKQPEW